MPTTETYYYRGILYTWHHEPQNEYSSRHISIASAVQALNRSDTVVIVQQVDGKERYKHIGLSAAGIIVVITDETETRIITVWHASSAEVKEWLARQ